MPSFLKKGDTIAVVAPSGYVAETLPLHIIESYGYHVITGKHLYEKYGTFAGGDAQRLADLQEMLNNASVKAIFCARGGYGITRILDAIDWKRFLDCPKWIVGFSDITALHLKIQQLGICSIHGIMPIHFHLPEAESSLKSLLECLEGNIQFHFPQHPEIQQKGKAEGVLIGGNLTMLCNQIGTPSLPSVEFFQNKILFLEEVHEPLYHIDRLMTQLARIGVFELIQGLLVGYFTIKPNIPEFGLSLKEIILEKTQAYAFPIVLNIPCGHEFPNFPLVLGKKIVLQAQQTVSLCYQNISH